MQILNEVFLMQKHNFQYRVCKSHQHYLIFFLIKFNQLTNNKNLKKLKIYIRISVSTENSSKLCGYLGKKDSNGK